MSKNNAHLGETREQRLERFQKNPPYEVVATLTNSIANHFINELRTVFDNRDNYQTTLMFLGTHSIALTITYGPYRHFTESQKIGEFEYAVWSFLWGVVLFLSFDFVISREHISLPPIPLNNPGALLGSLVGMSLGLAVGGAFALGFLGAFLSRLGLFPWIDKVMFWLLNKPRELIRRKSAPDSSPKMAKENEAEMD